MPGIVLDIFFFEILARLRHAVHLLDYLCFIISQGALYCANMARLLDRSTSKRLGGGRKGMNNFDTWIQELSVISTREAHIVS